MSWLRQGSQNSLEKPKLMEDQQEFQEEVLDFMGLGFCMPREAWRLPPPNLFNRFGPPRSPVAILSPPVASLSLFWHF